MSNNLVYILGLICISIVLVFLTPLISFGMWKFYRKLAIYHPTDNDMEKFIKNNPNESSEDYIKEGWFLKFGYTFAINFATVGIAMLLTLIYGIIIFGLNMTFSALFGSGIVIVAVNTALRVGDVVKIRQGRQKSEDVRLLSFGHTFFTSMWVLSALGSTVAVLSGQTSQIISNTTYSLDLTNGIYWGFIFIVFMISIPLLTEYWLANKVDFNDKSIDYEYTLEALQNAKSD